MIPKHKLAPEKNTERKKKGTSLVFVKGRVWHIEQNGFKLHLIKNQNSKQTNKEAKNKKYKVTPLWCDTRFIHSRSS